MHTIVQAEQSPKQLTTVRLQLKWRHQFQFAGFYAAVEQGFFAQQGLRVELIEWAPGIVPSEQLDNSQVDFAIDTPSVLIQRANGKKYMALGAIFQHSPAALMVRSNSGITAPEDLRGKKIGLLKHAAPEIMAMLYQAGIMPSEIYAVPTGWKIDLFTQGKIDAQSVYVTNEPYLVQREGIEIALLKPFSYGVDFYGDTIFSRADFVHDNPQLVSNFLLAVRQGWKYAMHHPEKVADYIIANYAPQKTRHELLYEASVMRELIQPEFVEIGYMSPDRWQKIADTFVRLGMMDKNYDLEDFLYSQYLQNYQDREHKKRESILKSLFFLLALGICIAVILFLFSFRLTQLVQRRTRELAASENIYRTFFELASVGVSIVRMDTRKYHEVNAKYCEIIGYSHQELMNMSIMDVTHPADRDLDRQLLQDLSEGLKNDCTIEKRYIRKDGSVVWVILTLSLIPPVDGKSEAFSIGIIRDITKRKNAEEELVLAGKLFEQSIEGIVITDSKGAIQQVNPAFTEITGYTAEEAIGKNPRLLKSDRHSPMFYTKMWKQLNEQGHWQGEIWNRKKNGESYPEWLTISTIHNAEGNVTNYVSIFHDISELKHQENRLHYQAQHDALTGLPNRILFLDRLNVALTRLERVKTSLAVLFIDLDHFKHINDARGHTTGDDLLIECAYRMQNKLRSGDTLARFGGDEFLLLLPEISDINQVVHIASRILDAIRQPFKQQETPYFITASLGITLAPQDGMDAEKLIKNADMAMYKAKATGRDTYHCFTHEMDTQARKRVNMEAQIRHGLEQGEFELHYQPLINILSGHIYAAEALIRWRRNGKLISPGEFIPIAEESGLIIHLGEMVIRSAAAQAKTWHDNGYQVNVSINISPRQFIGQELISKVRQILEETRVPVERLYFEITESMLMDDILSSMQILGELRELGIRFYLDDFGTGYSSLSYLKRLPIDGLKIDRSFIQDVVEDPDSSAIVESIVQLAQTLNLSIVAEGVETHQQKVMLSELGDMLLQGYLASPPVTPGQFETFLKKGVFDLHS